MLVVVSNHQLALEKQKRVNQVIKCIKVTLYISGGTNKTSKYKSKKRTGMSASFFISSKKYYLSIAKPCMRRRSRRIEGDLDDIHCFITNMVFTGRYSCARRLFLETSPTISHQRTPVFRQNLLKKRSRQTFAMACAMTTSLTT